MPDLPTLSDSEPEEGQVNDSESKSTPVSVHTSSSSDGEKTPPSGSGSASDVAASASSEGASTKETMGPDFLGWENHRLELLLVFDEAMRASQISNASLCKFTMERPNQGQSIPVQAELRKTDNNMYAIKTNDDESRQVQFGDLVFGSAKSDQPLFVVSKATMLEPHIFKIEMTKVDERFSLDTGTRMQVQIRPFALNPIPNKCKITTRADILELWMAAATTEHVTIHDINEYLRINPVAALFLAAINKIAVDTEADIDDAAQQLVWSATSHKLLVEQLKSMFQEVEARFSSTTCPFPLVDGKCVDLSDLNDADRDSDIRSYTLFKTDVRSLKANLDRVLGENSASQLCVNLTGSQYIYSNVMRQNLLLWQNFADQNLQLKTVAHVLIHQLIRHYVLIFGVSKTNAFEDAARMWLQFYVAMPLFFFAISEYVYKFRNLSTQKFENKVVFIMQHFHKMLVSHLNDFLPPNRMFDNVFVLNQIRIQLDNVKHTLSQFRFVPKTL